MSARATIPFDVYLFIDVDDVIESKAYSPADETSGYAMDISKYVRVVVYKNENGKETFLTYKGNETIKLNGADLKDEVQFKVANLVEEEQEYSILLVGYDMEHSSNSAENNAGMSAPELHSLVRKGVALVEAGKGEVLFDQRVNYWSTKHIVPGNPGTFRCKFKIFDKKGTFKGYCGWSHKLQSGS
ncbi:AidA/PixA family protein [Pseudomonas aeruginosa]